MEKITAIIICCLVASCSSSKDDKKAVALWQGKEMLYPQQVEYKAMARDTSISCDYSYTILTYIDSIGCTGCQLNIPAWKQMIDSLTALQLDAHVLFVVHSNDYEYFELMLKIYNFTYPIAYDYHNTFDKLNHFPPAPYRTFLLDKDNNVLLVGSPVNNPAMWALYKKMITQSK
jgi:hypothetical protein